MEQEIKVKRTEYGFVTVDIPEGEDPFDTVYNEYTAGNVNWGDEEFEVLNNGEEDILADGENRIAILLENALSVIREHTENPDEMDYQEEFIRVLKEELGMKPDEIREFTGIEVDDE